MAHYISECIPRIKICVDLTCPPGVFDGWGSGRLDRPQQGSDDGFAGWEPQIWVPSMGYPQIIHKKQGIFHYKPASYWGSLIETTHLWSSAAKMAGVCHVNHGTCLIGICHRETLGFSGRLWYLWIQPSICNPKNGMELIHDIVSWWLICVFFVK